MRFIFDSHLDLAWNAISWKRDLRRPIDQINASEATVGDWIPRGNATTSLPEMRRGGIFTCLGTIMARVPHGSGPVIFGDTLDFPSQDIAWSYAQSQRAYYEILDEQGEIRWLRSSTDLDQYWHDLCSASTEQLSTFPIGLILAMEGADSIVSPQQVSRWWEEGLRCASLVHYGVSAYAHGTGEEGPLTPAGRELLKAFNEVGMILDVTHLCDTSFWEVIDHFDGPILASHQNCRALVPGQRQFSDEQIKAVIDREGVLGVAMDAWMLDPNWIRPTRENPGSSSESVPIASLVDHIDHICQLSSNVNHVAIGSDLDGGFGNEQTPHELRTIADVQQISNHLAARGYSDTDIDAIFHRNHLSFFLKHLP